MTPIEILSAAFGLAGTVLLAVPGRFAGWGFVAFLASNAGWLVFSWSHDLWAMFVQQIGFTASSLAGIWFWLVAPRRQTRAGSARRIAELPQAWQCTAEASERVPNRSKPNF